MVETHTTATIIQRRKKAIGGVKLRLLRGKSSVLINKADVMIQLYQMGDALNRFGERLSSVEGSGKRKTQYHPREHRSVKKVPDDGFKKSHEFYAKKIRPSNPNIQKKQGRFSRLKARLDKRLDNKDLRIEM